MSASRRYAWSYAHYPRKKVSVVNVALGAQLSDEFVCERMAKKSNFFKVEILMSCSVGLVVPIEVVYPHQ